MRRWWCRRWRIAASASSRSHRWRGQSCGESCGRVCYDAGWAWLRRPSFETVGRRRGGLREVHPMRMSPASTPWTRHHLSHRHHLGHHLGHHRAADQATTTTMHQGLASRGTLDACVSHAPGDGDASAHCHDHQWHDHQWHPVGTVNGRTQSVRAPACCAETRCVVTWTLHRHCARWRCGMNGTCGRFAVCCVKGLGKTLLTGAVCLLQTTCPVRARAAA